MSGSEKGEICWFPFFQETYKTLNGHEVLWDVVIRILILRLDPIFFYLCTTLRNPNYNENTFVIFWQWVDTMDIGHMSRSLHCSIATKKPKTDPLKKDMAASQP